MIHALKPLAHAALLTIANNLSPAAWQYDTLICTSTAIGTIEEVARNGNFRMILDDHPAGIIVFSSRDDTISRDIYFQFVLRVSKRDPLKSFIVMNVRTLDGVDFPDSVKKTVQLIQDNLRRAASAQKCA